MIQLTTIFLMVILNIHPMNEPIDRDAKIITFKLPENGNFPNNQELPVLLYKKVFDFGDENPASTIEEVFEKNNWGGTWRNGIFNYHHYHTVSHEALGVYEGWAEVMLGGPDGKTVRIEKGDLVVLPAGTSHKRIDSGDGFAVVGSYPEGRNYDMNYGKPEELDKAKKNIPAVPLPEKDPVYGNNGKMFDYWK